MVKMIVFYTTPKDKEAFDKYYLETHVPLCQKFPNVQRVEVTRFTGAMGGDPPYYLMFQAWWNTKEEMDASLGSPEGRAVVKDTRNFEQGLMTVAFGETID